MTVGITSTVRTADATRLPRIPANGARTMSGTRVAEGDDDRLLIQPGAVQPVENSPDLRVHVCDLAGVRTLGERRLVRLGRIVGRVRIVEVQPGEELLRLVGLQPGERVVDDFPAAPRHVGERDAAVLREIELVEVRVEPLVQPPFAVEHEGSDERAGLPAAGLERVRKRHVRRIEHVSAVVAHAVLGRKQAREDRRMRRKRERRRGRDVLEQRPLARKTIERGRRGGRVTVGADAIRSRRVERDQEDVEIFGPHAAERPPEFRAAAARRGPHAQADVRRRRGKHADDRHRDIAEPRRAGTSCRWWRIRRRGATA
jgi:hypothetical protein